MSVSISCVSKVEHYKATVSYMYNYSKPRAMERKKNRDRQICICICILVYTLLTVQKYHMPCR